MPAGKSKLVVIAATTANALIALTKFFAAWLTGSSAMLSEAVHSVVDTCNQLLLLHGMHRAEKPPDDSHPLGYGRELYFWSFVVALILFTLGAGVTGYEGVLHILKPEEISDPLIAYAVYGAAAIFEGTSWSIALREFRRAKGDLGYYEAIRLSKDPATFTVLLEDSAALLGLAIAAAGTFATEQLSIPEIDGVASIGIALVLAATAFALGRESKGLLLGEPASRELRQSILSIAQNTSGIERAQVVFTVHLSPQQVVVALNLDFSDELTAPDIERITAELESSVREAHPQVIAIFVKPQTMPVSSPGRLGGAARKFGG